MSAIYAFYDGLRFDADHLADSIDSHKTNYGREIQMNKENWPLDFVLTFRGNPERFKGEGLKLVNDLSDDESANIKNILHFLSILNEPLYIGKTNNLRTRFIAHHDTGFLYKMKKEYKRPATEFVLLAFLCDSSYIRVVESILIQIINPPHCMQKS